jgi:hypothetical protein
VLGVFVDFMIALSLTILLELVVVIVFGFRERRAFFAVAAINFITNPLLNYSILIIRSLNLFRVDFFVLLIFELIVVLVEWRLLVFSVCGSAKKLLMLSLVMNLFSFASGLLLFHLV